ncbi:hypothetical protein ACQKWADRAFT_313870 [Trichoderma austrokoningii]
MALVLLYVLCKGFCHICPKDVLDILNKANIGKIRDDLEALKRNVEALMTAVAAEEALAETLRDILTSTRDESRAMREALTGLVSALTALADDVRAMRGASTDLIGQMTATRGEVGAMREKVQGQIADVATSVNTMCDAFSDLRLLRTDVSKIQRAGDSPLRSHLG